jgi:hypothetical protein
MIDCVVHRAVFSIDTRANLLEALGRIQQGRAGLMKRTEQDIPSTMALDNG